VIDFDEGSRVSKDQVMAVLEHADLDAVLAAADASVARAEAALAEQQITIALAEREMKRAELLWGKNSIAESERDQAQFAYQSAVARNQSLAAELQLSVARRSEAEQLKENMFIRAPFDGTVISKDAEVGESILPGGMGEASGRGSVATIADLEHLEIECDVKEDFISRIAESQAAEVAVDAVPGKKYRGQVRKIIPMGDRARATIKVQVEILDADRFLFPEMSGTVYFLPDEQLPAEAQDQPRLFCPDSAVTSDPSGSRFVWLVDAEGFAQSVAVDCGESRDGSTEILSGLSGDERLIVNAQSLVEGESVKVAE
jgi:RND family efflux transporter MFP subunit